MINEKMGVFKSNLSIKEKIYLVVSSFVITLTLCAKWEVIPETGMTHPIAEVVNKIAYSFSFEDYADILLLLGIFFMIRAIYCCDKHINVFIMTLSGILSFIYISCKSFMLYSSMQLLDSNGYQFVYSIFLWIGMTHVIYYGLRLCQYLLQDNTVISGESDSHESDFFRRHIFIISFCVIFIGWLFWLMCTFPGICNIDAIAQLLQFYGYMGWTTHHPPLSTFIMGSLLTFGKVVFKSADIGFFLYLLVQTFIGAIIFAYGILLLKNEFKIRNRYLFIVLLFFAVVPFWGVYAALYEKSLLYSEFATLLTIIVMPIIKKGQSFFLWD